MTRKTRLTGKCSPNFAAARAMALVSREEVKDVDQLVLLLVLVSECLGLEEDWRWPLCQYLYLTDDHMVT